MFKEKCLVWDFCFGNPGKKNVWGLFHDCIFNLHIGKLRGKFTFQTIAGTKPPIYRDNETSKGLWNMLAHVCVYIYFKSAQNEEIWNTQSSFLAGVLVTVSKAHSFGSLYPKPGWSNMVKMHVFFVIFRLPNINISSHRNTERCKRYPASLILFGLWGIYWDIRVKVLKTPDENFSTVLHVISRLSSVVLDTAVAYCQLLLG